MKRWSWKQSPGTIRSTVLLGIILTATLGVMYFTPLFYHSHNVTSLAVDESQPHTHGIPQALAATPPSAGTPAAPLLSLEQQDAILAHHRERLRAIPGVIGVTIETADTILVDVFVHTDQSGRKPAVLPDALRTIPPFLDAVPVKLEFSRLQRA
jgi:hypothetical protein